MALSTETCNRWGFFILGLTNLSVYCIMLAAAYDLLSKLQVDSELEKARQAINTTSTISVHGNESYCNGESTGTVLVANSVPGLIIKIVYPFLLVNIKPEYKVIAVAMLAASAFILTGLSHSKTLVFMGIIFASLSQGLGEPLFVSSKIYGKSSFIGWSMGSGAAGIFGAMFYAILRHFLSIKVIMMIMLAMPISLLIAYFYIIKPLDIVESSTDYSMDKIDGNGSAKCTKSANDLNDDSSSVSWTPFNFKAKLYHLPSLAKYFLPLTLVYFAEYFINMGTFELIYYPEITYLDHAAQYRWFQVAYQLGVMVSRSTLDFFVIKRIWTMSLLQTLNLFIFLAHVFRLIHIPNFYILYLLILYEGLLGGFTYINAFFRIKTEIKCSEKQEFSASATTIADSMGIVAAGLAAVPFHNSLCKLYDSKAFISSDINLSNIGGLVKFYQDVSG